MVDPFRLFQYLNIAILSFWALSVQITCLAILQFHRLLARFLKIDHS